MTNVDGGPFIILLGRMEMRRSPRTNTSDLSDTELLWMVRFLMSRMRSQASSSSPSMYPSSLEAPIMSRRYILPPCSDALALIPEDS